MPAISAEIRPLLNYFPFAVGKIQFQTTYLIQFSRVAGDLPERRHLRNQDVAPGVGDHAFGTGRALQGKPGRGVS